MPQVPFAFMLSIPNCIWNRVSLPEYQRVRIWTQQNERDGAYLVKYVGRFDYLFLVHQNDYYEHRDWLCRWANLFVGISLLAKIYTHLNFQGTQVLSFPTYLKSCIDPSVFLSTAVEHFNALDSSAEFGLIRGLSVYYFSTQPSI